MRPGPDAPSLAAALIIVLGTASDANCQMISLSTMQRCNAACAPAAEKDPLTLRL